MFGVSQANRICVPISRLDRNVSTKLIAKLVRIVFHPVMVIGCVMTGLVALLVFEVVNALGSRHIVGGVYSNAAGFCAGSLDVSVIRPAVL